MIAKVNDKQEIIETVYSFAYLFRTLSDPNFNLVHYCEKISEFGQIIKYIEDDKCIGFCAYYINDIKMNKAFISLIGVESAFQGKSIGHQLLEYVINDSRKANMKIIELCVNINNYNAIEFYERNGFIKIKKDKDIDQYLMALFL